MRQTLLFVNSIILLVLFSHTHLHCNPTSATAVQNDLPTFQVQNEFRSNAFVSNGRVEVLRGLIRYELPHEENETWDTQIAFNLRGIVYLKKGQSTAESISKQLQQQR